MAGPVVRHDAILTEREKMLRGDPYLASDPELAAMRLRARRLWQSYNASDPSDISSRRATLEQLLGAAGRGCTVEPPFMCDYGTHIELGADVFINFNCVFLDCAAITIGAQSQLGPSVQLYAATHPIDATARVAGPELAYPISIGRRVWIGGGTIVLPGVTIGDDSVIGAGSVVTKSVPPRIVAAGNPCRVLRSIDPTESARNA